MKIDKIYRKGKLSIGLELPLDNDWSIQGEHKRKQDGRPFGVPDITHHSKYVKMADTLGFKALWMRDVPVYDPSFGDAAQQFEVFSYLDQLIDLLHDYQNAGVSHMAIHLRKSQRPVDEVISELGDYILPHFA